MEVIDHSIVFHLFGILPIRDTVLYTWITMGIIIGFVLLLKVLKPNLLEYILEMVISVLDDGVGLPPAALEHLFDGYGGHSDNSAKSGRRSMGIGLSVCNTIIGVHGGAMWAKNKEECGAEVGFWLPCEEDCCEQYAQG